MIIIFIKVNHNGVFTKLYNVLKCLAGLVVLLDKLTTG